MMIPVLGSSYAIAIYNTNALVHHEKMDNYKFTTIFRTNSDTFSIFFIFRGCVIWQCQTSPQAAQAPRPGVHLDHGRGFKFRSFDREWIYWGYPWEWISLKYNQQCGNIYGESNWIQMIDKNTFISSHPRFGNLKLLLLVLGSLFHENDDQKTWPLTITSFQHRDGNIFFGGATNPIHNS
jgi:hypothetical protein